MSTKLTGYVWDGCAASGMKLSSVAIMARLADFSNDEGVCWPSIETIARQIGAGMSTVRTAIARLEAEGWLTRKARRQGNATSATIETLESPRERAALTGFSLIRLPDQEKWSGDGAGLKAITGGDAVSVDPKYRDAYSTHIPAVILAVNNNPMRFTDRSGGVSRRRVIIHFPEQIAPQERDPQLKDKITRELAVIVRHLMQKFSDPMLARSLLQSQQNSDEALNIKRDADPTFDFIGYLETLPQTSGMYMGNASIIPRNYRKYLYHAYLAYMEANGYRNVLSLKMFGLGLPVMLKEYGLNYEKRHTKQGIQTNLTLKEESYGDWLPKCDDPATT
ncbi:TPA: GntR family transcriptional regulator [Escherichia coli]|nr:GntR family transcriptional regulator [Escherichia coli]